MRTAEEWAIELERHRNELYSLLDFIRAIQADASSAPSVPDEPTPEMIEAAYMWFSQFEVDGQCPSNDQWCDCLRRVLAAAPKQPDGWMPIEIAPKDGTIILTDCGTARLCEDNNIWHLCDTSGSIPSDCEYGREISEISPTHWMLVPQPPKGELANLTAENERLRKALREISDSKFCAYENTSSGNYEGQYGVGVTDGHRFCANIAREALKEGVE